MHCFPDILTSALCTYIIQNMSGSVQSSADKQLALSGVKLAEVGIVLELEIPCALVAFPVCACVLQAIAVPTGTPLTGKDRY